MGDCSCSIITMKTLLAIIACLFLSKTLAQSNGCDSDQTEINSPWLFTTTETCPDLISGVPDYYSDVYRSECQRQLGLQEKPDSIPRADVAECYDMKNGTHKYRSKVCCPGSLEDTRCFTCNNISVDYDSDLDDRYHTYQCNHYGTVHTCQEGQVCATVYHYVNGRRVNKMCMDKEPCETAENNYSQTCKSGIPEPTCTYCCDGPLCNFHQYVPSRTPGDACYSNNCYNGLKCVLDPNESNGYRCEGECNPGYYGSNCQSNQCSVSPCKNSGRCYTRTSYPYYECYCKLSWGGDNCTEAIDRCDSSDFCQNGGECYDHEMYGLRCKCPSGFHGDQCELQATGAERCSDPDLFHVYSSSQFSTSSKNCTDSAIYMAEVTSLSESWGKNCASYMKQGYVEGVDGDITHPESMEYFTCERGDKGKWYGYDICCPSCTRKPCQNSGWCVQTGIDHTCRCRLGYAGDECQYNEALTVISGDPHVVTFDNRNLHPQGICKYNIATSEDPAATFEVTSKFERRGRQEDVSYVKYIDLKVYNHTVRLDRHNIVYVDGEVVDPLTNPSYANGKLKVGFNGNAVRAEVDFGLAIENDGEWTALVKVPSGLPTAGLAGNNNGDPSDDMVTKEGVDVTGMNMSQSILANSWQVDDPEDPGCRKEEVPDLKQCNETMEEDISSDNGLCGLIFHPNQVNNPFANCLASPLINGDAFAENCLFDVCALQDDPNDMKQAACGSLEALAAQCRNLGIVVDWRAAAECPFNCTGGREYTPSGSACTVTCDNPLAVEKCPLPNTETCLCPSGNVFHQDTCQHHSVCGCTGDDDQHYETGETWLSDDCTQRLTCTACADCGDSFGDIVETPHECPEGEKCNAGVCEDDDACSSDPCLNGGTCTLSENSFNCECPENFEGEHCETEFWYEFGPWSDWVCNAAGDEKVRYRKCYKMPAEDVVDDELCSGESQETKEVEVDCEECLADGGFASHECDDGMFWMCYGTVADCHANEMKCGVGTVWCQYVKACLHVGDQCGPHESTTPNPHSTTPPQDEGCKNDDGSYYEAIPGDPHSYKWILADGREYIMPCSPGTVFSSDECGCVVPLL